MGCTDIDHIDIGCIDCIGYIDIGCALTLTLGALTLTAVTLGVLTALTIVH